jgi:hypothetical protein
MRFAMAALLLASCATAAEQAKTEPYAIKGMSFEGCECESVCPCYFQNDATFNDCRGVLAWKVDEGKYGKVDLKGAVFAAALLKSGKNIEKVLGKWEGVVYLSDKSSDEQKAAITAILKAELGGAFGKLDVKTAPLSVKCEGDKHEVEIGKIATLKIAGIKAPNGKVTSIENASSPLALPKAYCAKSTVNRYDDGAAKWDFAGRNGFYGEFEMKSK